jgi:hypothetical protein
MNTVPHHLRNSNASSIVWGLLMKERTEEDAKAKLENTQPNGKSNGKQNKAPKKEAEIEEEPAKKSAKVPQNWKNAINRLSQGGGPFADTFQSLTKLDDMPTDSKKAFKVCSHLINH